ncbi:MAG TPA: TrkH family potassium uptake protein [Geminicoccaceae bacterium]|nr:TrkH family potassium uptake protein [Geminicoccaceae bacterium]
MVAVSRGVARPVVLDLRPILQVIGILLIILALFMAPPMVADMAAGHRDWQVFLVAGAVTLFIGVSLVLMNRAPGFGELTGRQAFLLTTTVWVVIAVFAALPLAFSELQLSAADAVFEAMSGITTTGSTVIVGLDAAPPGILLWRAILQWLGGIGIIVMGVAILPMLSIGGMQLVRAESSDLSEKILPRAAQVAAAIGLIYLTLTLACAILYWYAGMSPFEATAHAMTTIATGGFSTSDASIGTFRSARIEWIAIVFMVIGSLPFVLYIQATNGHLMMLFRDAQVRWFLGITAGASLAIMLWLTLTAGAPPLEALRQSTFNTISVITGTGYASTDYGLWGTFPVAMLFFLMCVGGCTGSTTGGIKVFRVSVLHAVAVNQIARLVRPHGVFVPTFNGRPVPEAAAISVMAFVFMFALSFTLIAIGLSMLGLDYLTAMSGAVTALANVGPGLGDIIGPAGNFSSLPDSAKWLLSAAMLLGRLELFTVLILLTPGFWRG